MTVITIILVIVTAVIGAIILHRWQKLRPYNQSPLKIETFDGFNSPFHPSVLYFKDGWNGWKYWMVETPFSPQCKPYVDRDECPSIHVSNDGMNWTTPDGLQNPLVNFGEEGENNLDYYSDPHLVMVGNRMECWYRLTERHGDVDHRHEVSLRRIYSEDGIKWSDEEIISRLWLNNEDKGLGKMVVSQAVLYDSSRGYRMWYVNSEEHLGQRGVSFNTSEDGLQWRDMQICHFDKGINPWHIDVMEDDDYTLLMTVYDQNNLTLWKSTDGLKWSFIRELLSPSHIIGSFYRNGLYRSCLVKVDHKYKLYFSAYDYDNTYIGLAEMESHQTGLKFIPDRQNHTLSNFCRYAMGEEYRHIKFIITHLLNRK